jgi:heme-degrading monooxygenase HmoA
MIVERVELPVKAGQEQEFLKALAEGNKIIAAAKGCQSVTGGMGVENPSKAIMLIGWDTVDAHTAFTQTPEFGKLVELIAGFFDGEPAVEHFDCI